MAEDSEDDTDHEDTPTPPTFTLKLFLDSLFFMLLEPRNGISVSLSCLEREREREREGVYMYVRTACVSMYEWVSHVAACRCV